MEPVSEVTDDLSAPRARSRVGLSGKLLFLTIAFVTVAEIFIYVPWIANFRLNWLNDRLAAAHTAALVIDAAPKQMVPESLAKMILDSIGAHAVAIKMGNERRLLAVDNVPSQVTQNVDMRNIKWWPAIMEAFDTLLFTKPGDVIRLVGPAPMVEGQFLEVVLDAPPLSKAMWSISADILIFSLMISGISATLVFFALHYLLVRPMARITGNMIAFRADPENPTRIIGESGRGDEVGRAEEELAAMQRELASMLHQKSRLAALGLAVSKINHDLRNLLASAQLFSDQLSTLPDPKVQRFAPKLMRTLERAIAFCQSTLSYGAAQEPPPERKTVEVEPLIEEVHEALGLTLDVPIRWIVSVERGLTRRGRPRPAFPRAGQRRAQRRAEPAGARRARSGARPDPHHRPARRQRGRARSIRHRAGRFRQGAQPHVRGVPGLDLGRRRPRACHRRRTDPRPWRRYRLGARHHRRDISHLDSRPRHRSQFPARGPRQRLIAPPVTSM